MSKVMVTLQDLGILASTAERNGTQDAFVEVALQWAGEANATIASLTADCRTLEMGQAEAMALALSHEGAIARLTAERDAAKEDAASLLRLVVDLRYALGDDGRRMQPELVEYAKQMRTDLGAARAEVEALRSVGGQLANVAFNMAQRAGQTLSTHDAAIMDKLRREWAAARKAAATPPDSKG